METKITSATSEIIIGDTVPTVLIGERINPTGKKKLQEALKAGNLDIVEKEALQQAASGADMLDINVGTFGIDEVTMLPRVVQLVTGITDKPLCFDSTNPDALEAAMKVYKGKPLINSVSGEENSLQKVLPLIKEYGAAVIGLVQDDRGIPTSTERRIEIAHKIVERAGATGIPREDVIIDVETFSVGADPTSGPQVLEAIRLIKAELGVNTTLAASNVSFGLPDRPLLNNAFVAMAIAMGLSCMIVDARKVLPSVLAADLICGKDKRARRYITAYRQRQQPK